MCWRRMSFSAPRPCAKLPCLMLPETVASGRQAVKAVLDGRDSRLLVVVGPCSIHDPEAALEYAQRLLALSQKLSSSLLILMRVYFEKPRTTTGWKGLINDPHMDDSFQLEEGLHIARRLLVDLAEMGMPVATEALDPISPSILPTCFPGPLSGRAPRNPRRTGKWLRACPCPWVSRTAPTAAWTWPSMPCMPFPNHTVFSASIPRGAPPSSARGEMPAGM